MLDNYVQVGCGTGEALTTRTPSLTDSTTWRWSLIRRRRMNKQTNNQTHLQVHSSPPLSGPTPPSRSFPLQCKYLSRPAVEVPEGSPSRGGDVAVYVLDINQPSLSTPFYSVLVSMSVFMALSPVFHSILSPDNSPLSDSVLPVLFLPYWSFQLHICSWKSPSVLI